MLTLYVIMGIVWAFIAMICEFEKKGRFDAADIGVCIVGFILWPVLTVMFLAAWFVHIFKGK